MNDLGGGLRRPGDLAKAGKIGPEFQVPVGGIEAEIAVLLGILARYGLHEDRGRQGHGCVDEEFRRRHDLAAGDAGQVRHQAFDLGHAAGIGPGLGFSDIGDGRGLFGDAVLFLGHWNSR